MTRSPRLGRRPSRETVWEIGPQCLGALGGATATFPDLPRMERNLSICGLGLTAATRDDGKLKALKTFVGDGLAAGDLKPTIARTFPFDKIVDAHRYLEAGEQIGQIVVTVTMSACGAWQAIKKFAEPSP